MNSIKLHVNNTNKIRLNVSTKCSDIEYAHYAGPYEVVPDIREQALYTKNKVMNEDVVVKEIPYAETSNDFGVTVVIAS